MTLSGLDSQLRNRARLRRTFDEEGYVVIPQVVDPEQLAALARDLHAEFETARERGRLFTGGGTLSGHLNCFPGVESRFVWDALEEHGIPELVRALSPTPLLRPNVGCNFNLPNSHEQNEHIDGYAESPFLVANVAVVDTDLENGAMEILRRTHRWKRQYWQLMLESPERLRVCVKAGDVVVRVSTLWHRGMPNHTPVPRPMLAFTWEDGGTPLADPYSLHGGRVTFLPNRYSTEWTGRLRERAFVAAPRLGKAIRIVQSLLESL